MYRNYFLLCTALLLFSTTKILSQNGAVKNKLSENIDIQDEIRFGSFIDQRDQKSYKTVDIGDQTWMAENMSFLPAVSPNNTASGSNAIYYVYAYEGSNVKTAKSTDNYKNYGVLYNWTAAISVCPKGWHLPSGYDWDNLVNYLGHPSVAGNKMKTTGSTHWKESNVKVTNSSGFDALPGGAITTNEGADNINKKANFWGTEVRDSNNMSTRSLSFQSGWVGGTFFPKNAGLSVRCLKN